MPTIKHRILAAAAAIAITLSAGAAQANSLSDTTALPDVSAALAGRNPEIVLKLHGFLSRARFQCDFRYYSQRMTDLAVAAATQIPSKKTVSALVTDGMKSFDQGAAHSSLRSACASAAGSFPAFSRP